MKIYVGDFVEIWTWHALTLGNTKIKGDIAISCKIWWVPMNIYNRKMYGGEGVKCKFLYKHAIRRLKRVFNWIPGILSSV